MRFSLEHTFFAQFSQGNSTNVALDLQKEVQMTKVTFVHNVSARYEKLRNNTKAHTCHTFQAATCTFSHLAPLGRAKRKVIFEKKTLVVHSVDCQASHQHVMPLNRHDFYDFADSIHFSKCRLTLYGSRFSSKSNRHHSITNC